MRMTFGRAVLVMLEVGIGGFTDLFANWVEHLTPVEVVTPAVIVNVSPKT